MMSTVTIPKTVKAMVIPEGHVVTWTDHPVRTVGDNDILVKTVAVAQNPTDWKFVDFRGKPGSILGLDWSGRVVQVGKNVSTPKVGERVAGFVQGGTYADSGAYAEYVKTSADLEWVIPEGTLSDEQAATLGCAFWTAVQALYNPRRLGLIEPPNKVDREQWIFVYGGSSSVGQFAIQLAHLSGYKVVTTSSPRNFDFMTSLRADIVFDYNDPNVGRKIKKATDCAVVGVVDTISTKESQKISVQVMRSGGGRAVLVLVPVQETKVRDDVEMMQTMVYTALGHAVDFGPNAQWPVSPEDRAHMVAFLKKVPALVSEGKIRPNPVKLWEGGLLAVPEGLQYAREGKVRAEKMVYRV